MAEPRNGRTEVRTVATLPAVQTGAPEWRPADPGRAADRPITVLLVDGHTLFRQGVREMMCGTGLFRVLGEGATAGDLAALAEAARPDVVLFDLDISKVDTAVALREAARHSPLSRLVLFSMVQEAGVLQAALGRGVHACLPKTIGKDELMAAVWLVSRSPECTLTMAPRSAAAAGPGGLPLSSREAEVLRLLGKGHSNTQIARQLYVSESTVKRHLCKIYAKLGAVSRIDAMTKAASAGMLTVHG